LVRRRRLQAQRRDDPAGAPWRRGPPAGHLRDLRILRRGALILLADPMEGTRHLLRLTARELAAYPGWWLDVRRARPVVRRANALATDEAVDLLTEGVRVGRVSVVSTQVPDEIKSLLDRLSPDPPGAVLEIGTS